MKKLTKKTLDELARTMNVIPEEERDGYWGMYDNDCFWRCVAYINTGDGTEEAAASYALSYWTEVYGCVGTAHSNLSNNGAGMSSNDAKSYIKSNSIQGGLIYYFDVDNISAFSSTSISGAWHAVVMTSGDGFSTTFYDPQNDEYITISNSEMSSSNTMVIR